MDQYEKEMFDFLTQEENLKGLIIAKNQFNTVSETLVKTLWDKVYDNLTKQFEARKEWKVMTDKQISDSHSKVYLCDTDLIIQKDGLPSMFFGWERLSQSYPYYGFWINLDSEEFRAYDIKDFLLKQKREIAAGFKGPDGGWLFWDQSRNLDFKIDNTLLNIIPTRVDVMAEELSHLLLDLFQKMEGNYKVIKKDYKK